MSKIRHIPDSVQYRTKKYYNSMEDYIAKNGPHFNEKLCKFAVDRMTTAKGKITPYTKAQVEQLLQVHGVKVNNIKGYDHVFVANMGQADYLYSSVKDESYLAKYIKDVLDDPDGYEGIAFIRWCADIEYNKVDIDWDSM